MAGLHKTKAEKSASNEDKEQGVTKETSDEIRKGEDHQCATSNDNNSIEGEENDGRIGAQVDNNITGQEEGQDNNLDDNGPELAKDIEKGKK